MRSCRRALGAAFTVLMISRYQMTVEPLTANLGGENARVQRPRVYVYVGTRMPSRLDKTELYLLYLAISDCMCFGVW